MALFPRSWSKWGHALCAAVVGLACAPTHAQSPLAPIYSDYSEQAYRTALDAYLYFYPLVVDDLTRGQMTGLKQDGPNARRAPSNTFAAMTPCAQCPGQIANDPNISLASAWVDLRDGPVLLKMPDTHSRYYALTVLDGWHDTVAVLGKRTTGTQAGQVLLVPPDWTGTLPSHLAKLSAPTATLWLQLRIRQFGASDREAVNTLAQGFALTTQWDQSDVGQSVQLRGVEPVDMKQSANDLADAMDAQQFFKYAMTVWRRMAPHANDQPIIARLAALGLVRGRDLAFDDLDPRLQQGLRRAVTTGRALLNTPMQGAGIDSHQWLWSREGLAAWGNSYVDRARAARLPFGQSAIEDQVQARLDTDVDGQPLLREVRYTLHFAADALPPTRTGWSLSAVSAQRVGATATPPTRYTLSDSDPLRYNADGSLDVFVGPVDANPDIAANSVQLPVDGASLLLRIDSPDLLPRSSLQVPIEWRAPVAVPPRHRHRQYRPSRLRKKRRPRALYPLRVRLPATRRVRRRTSAPSRRYRRPQPCQKHPIRPPHRNPLQRRRYPRYPQPPCPVNTRTRAHHG